MADGTITVTEGSGKILDTTQLTVGSNTVQRERISLAGNTASGVADVKNVPPLTTDYGLLSRIIDPYTSPKLSSSSSSVASAAAGTFDSAQISSTKTGKLVQIIVACDVAAKVDIQTLLNGSATTKLTLIKPALQTLNFALPSKEFITQVENATAGLDGFRLNITNLGNKTDTIYASIFYDEE
jgi:hypothetical protein